MGAVRSRAVTVVQAILVVNALPAFINLMSIPDRTDNWFVWTVKPAANARVLGVMYGSACLLGLLGYAARTWPRQRATFVVVAPFAVAATIVTLVVIRQPNSLGSPAALSSPIDSAHRKQLLLFTRANSLPQS